MEGEERRLRAWDFVHCPAGTDARLRGRRRRACVLLLIGARTPDAEIVYPRSELALEARRRRRAGDDARPSEAYRRFRSHAHPYRQGWLPGA